MGDLITKKPTVVEAVSSPDEAIKREKSQEFYQELDTYRSRGRWLPVLLLLIVTVALIAFVSWYLQRTF